MHKKEYIIEAIADDKDYGFVGETIWQLPESNLLMMRKGELVRCKDCKWFNAKFGECEGELNRYIHTDGSTEFTVFEPEAEFYCAYGERKEQ